MMLSSAARSTLKPALFFQRGRVALTSSSFRGFAAPTSVDKSDTADPMEVFDMIDTNSDGVLSKEEFKVAVEVMGYDDLVKIKKSLARNELSYNPSADEEKSLTFTGSSVLMRRMVVTAEVAVSKIFPTGFGWQTAATLAEGAGLQGTDSMFFLATGLGDGFGVFAGHTLYMAGKKAVTGDDTIDLVAQMETGILLGSAAVCSGTVWQPTVNALQAAGWSFNTAITATGAAAVFAFFGGLRMGRLVYGNIFKGVESATYANLKADAALSVAVGGAAGAFLGTDLSYETGNFLAGVVGIPETATPLTASCLAGTSTALGFTVLQIGENVVYPKDKCWVD